MCKKIENGSVTLHDVDRMLSIFKNDEQALREELIASSNSPQTDWVEQRLKQYKQCQVMSEHKEAANILLCLRDMLELEGDFDPLEDIVSRVSINVVYISNGFI